MTRRTFIVLLCAGTLGAVVSSASAGSGYTGKYSGRIVRVLGNTIQVYVAEIDKTVSFWTDDRTKITRGKTKVTFAELRRGQTVTVDASMGRAKTINIDADPKSESKD